MASTKLADDPATEQAKRAYESEKKLSDASKAQYESKMKGKPTPTQEENDLAACGAHILEHEADGSDLDPNNFSSLTQDTKNLGASKPQAYQTRHTSAKTE
jgi:hypothetical protein